MSMKSKFVIFCNVSKNKEAEINLRRILIQLGMLKDADRERNIPNVINYKLALCIDDTNKLDAALGLPIEYSFQSHSYEIFYE